MNIAIIPARGGSKRIPGKNIKSFLGRPIIYYPIRAAKQSDIFDQIIVSTDTEEIASVARENGAKVPFLRPPEISDDFTPTAAVIQHALSYVEEKGISCEYACCIYATAAFVQPKHIRQGYEILTSHKVSSVFSVTNFPFSIFRALKITRKGTLKMFWPEYELTRSQDLPEAYHDAGQFYWLDCKTFLEEGRIYTADAMPVILPRHLVQDIDTLDDWEMAEGMFKALGLSRK